MKELVAQEIAKRVSDGEVIGVGTGSTVDLALKEIGRRVRDEGLKIKVVPTSYESAWQCQAFGLDVLYTGFRGDLAWGFDGADEVDDRFILIKGKGGALLQEKILAARCKEFVVIVDESKVVSKLGAKCAVPVEVIPQALSVVEKGLAKLGAVEVKLRQATGKHGAVITEAGNVIFDALFKEISETHERDIKALVGVVENGIFTNFASEVLVGTKTGVKRLATPERG